MGELMDALSHNVQSVLSVATEKKKRVVKCEKMKRKAGIQGKKKGKKKEVYACPIQIVFCASFVSQISFFSPLLSFWRRSSIGTWLSIVP
jgi:hypothetical protein